MSCKICLDYDDGEVHVEDFDEDEEEAVSIIIQIPSQATDRAIVHIDDLFRAEFQNFLEGEVEKSYAEVILVGAEIVAQVNSDYCTQITIRCSN